MKQLRDLSDYLKKDKVEFRKPDEETLIVDKQNLPVPKTHHYSEDITIHKGSFSAWKHYLGQKQNRKAKNVSTNSLVRKITDYLPDNIIGWAIAYALVRLHPKHNFRNYRDQNTGRFEVSGDFSVGLAADWASDTNASIAVAAQIKKDNPDYTIHLGDIYFVGEEDEVEANFDNSVWYYGKKGSFALEGNHEMYSSSCAYFDVLLKRMGTYDSNGKIIQRQEASFFCLENENWRIIGLDTGYNSRGWPILEYWFDGNCSFPKLLMNWLKHKVRMDDPDDKRGIIFLCHHQFFSAFDKNKQYKTPYCQISHLFDKKRTVLWFWGHEHILASYDQVHIKNLSFHGRCIGHGGQPVVLPEERELECKEFLPGFKYDDRENRDLHVKGLGFNGYTLLKFTGRSVEVLYKDLYGNQVPNFGENWNLDVDGNLV